MMERKDIVIIAGLLVLLAIFRNASAIPFMIGYVIGVSCIFDYINKSKKVVSHDP